MLDDTRRDFGSVFTLRLLPAPYDPVVIIGSAEGVAAIHAMPASDIDVAETNALLEVFFADKTILLSDGEAHASAR
jgi:hypothetical protein